MKQRRLMHVIRLLETRYRGCDARALIEAQRVVCAGKIVLNAQSLVDPGAPLRIMETPALRGSPKLRAALDAFGVNVTGKIAVDLGASAGGFTSVLLERGCTRVYAVDAGKGQLAQRLRCDLRVVNLEGTNLGDLGPDLVPEPVAVLSIDLSYLALHRAAPQLARVNVAPDADAIALVKPMFELGLGRLPTEASELEMAVERAVAGFSACGWLVAGTCRSPVLGAHGAVEFLLHARKRRPTE